MRQLSEDPVASGDLGPVPDELEVKVGDGSLDRVRPPAVAGDRTPKQVTSLFDLCLIPEASVLLVEQDELAVHEARSTPRVVEKHQGEQGKRLRFIGHQFGE